jgi:hypothetical protein
MPQTIQPGTTMNTLSDLQAALDPARKSWIESANDLANDFSIQNLPFGIFSDRHKTVALV